MSGHKYSLENVAIKYGLYTTIGLVAYFLAMKIMGMVHIIELRTLNFIILVAGIIKATRFYRDHNQEQMTYLKGFGIGILTAALNLSVKDPLTSGVGCCF